MPDTEGRVIRFNADISYRYPVTTQRDRNNAQRLQQFMDDTVDPFDRTTLKGHVTATAFIVDRQREYALMLHHRKLNMWLPPGGHCDGNADVMNTAIRETQEETGIKQVTVVGSDIFDIDIHLIPANSREPEHYHYDVRFLMEVDRNTLTEINNDEALKLEWVKIDRLDDYTQLPSVLVLRDKVELL
ncbi:NUDIX hydrolase [Enterobacteriaceae bacterium 4M9]|nr:NUDIX hydrolase [Enterobacteriaceae bacterium 4M9]